MNMLLIDALRCQNRSRAPIWLMRQAGRYMPEYRALRARYSFLEMCHHPHLIAEITQQPLHAFGMDGAIIFSDILIIPEALGLGLRFDEGIGPIIERPLQSDSDIEQLPRVEMREALCYLSEGIRLLVPELTVPLLGFAGAPFTIASYMIEGKSSRDLMKTKLWMMHHPTSFHQLLEKLTSDIIEVLNMQIDAGVSAVQLFDSWANVLSVDHFREFCLPYLKKIVDAIKGRVPIILFCRGSAALAPVLATTHPHAISVDWNCSLAEMRRAILPPIALQGNLDPDMLQAPLPLLQKAVRALLDAMRGDPGYVFNLGHGITPKTPVEAVKIVVECVKTYS